MNVLSGEDRLALRELLWEEMPEHLLCYLSVTGPCRRSQLVSEAIRWLPSQPASEIERERVLRMIEWFEARGDIYRVPQGRYRCLPPHAVGVVTDLSVDSLPLFGDPAVERDLEDALQSVRGRLQKKLVEEYESEEEKAEGMRYPVGIDRALCLPSKHRGELARKLEKIGITVLSPDDLRDNLPTIWELTLPGSQGFREPPNLKGVWEIYAPNQPCDYQAGRWIEAPDWKESPARLVRWTLAGRERNIEARRYFLHAGNGQVMELARDDALWWQFRLDADAKCPVTLRFCSNANEVWFNGHLPRAIAQWLRFIARQPLRRKKYWY
ncbi:MAG TPA: hypothetical protein EYP19_11270, partial [Desulfobacterales bacterium]|nr:hypothetical protein [Desulfobacterales bacterium]